MQAPSVCVIIKYINRNFASLKFSLYSRNSTDTLYGGALVHSNRIPSSSIADCTGEPKLVLFPTIPKVFSSHADVTLQTPLISRYVGIQTWVTSTPRDKRYFVNSGTESCQPSQSQIRPYSEQIKERILRGCKREFGKNFFNKIRYGFCSYYRMNKIITIHKNINPVIEDVAVPLRYTTI